MHDFLKSLEIKPVAVIDPLQISLDHIGRFGKGLSVPSKDSQFLLYFFSKCLKVLQLYCPIPDLRPKILCFAPLKEAGQTKEMLALTTISKSNFLCGKEILYRIYNTENKLVRSILENAGLKCTDTHVWNLLWVGKTFQPFLYDDLNPYQRINHYPNSFEITRKDKMCLNLQLMKSKFPSDYEFFPDTYIIPDNIGEFSLRFYSEDCQWIVKPTNSSQGKGIFILDSLNSLDLEGGCIVSKYIDNPLLVNNLKCDLRLYVLIASFEPLKIYVYEEGLARFACDDYKSEDSTNKYVYLTNYSINKKNEKFIQNTDWQEDNIGHKWSFSAFFKELIKLGYDTDIITKRIYDLIIKTIISIESLVVESVRKRGLKHNNCFDLLGFDIMLDQTLKPWLLEVNLSPSMNTDSPLDLHIKSSLIADTLNLIGIRAFDRKKELATKAQNRVKAKSKKSFSSKPGHKKIDDSKYKSLYLETIEETLRTGHFIRIFPFCGCEQYEKFFKTPRKVNKILYTFLFNEVLKNDNVFPGVSPSLSEDDIINEYLSRVVKAIKGLGEKISKDLQERIDKIAEFLNPGQEPSLLRLQKYVNSQGILTKFRNEKFSLLKTFVSGQLENLIKSMDKPIVPLLFSGSTAGILDESYKVESGKEEKPKGFRFLKVKSA